MAQVWYEEWNEEKPIRLGYVDWALLKTAILCRFLFLELGGRKKIQEFINLRQGGLSVQQ